jgi:hypothetical protein
MITREIEGRLYTFAAVLVGHSMFSEVFFALLLCLRSLLITDGLLYPNFYRPFSSLHPWRNGFLLLCIVTPRLPGWKTVVYPASASFGTLTNECIVRCGKTCACLAPRDNCSNGKFTVCVACIDSPLGNMTDMLELPVTGKSSAPHTKCDVAPESNTISFVFVFGTNFMPQRSCSHLQHECLRSALHLVWCCGGLVRSVEPCSICCSVG